MAMDFAPYQSSPPEHSRIASPDFASPSPRLSADAGPRLGFARSPPPLQHPQPQRAWAGGGGFHGHPDHDSEPERAAPAPYDVRVPVAHVGEFDTSLGLRLDHEACLAYLALPPLGAILLLIFERNSDYVRFHAWQSALLFTALMVVHLIFSWSSFLSWLLFLGDIALIALLTLRAYRDAEILDRYELPFFGRIASGILDDE